MSGAVSGAGWGAEDDAGRGAGAGVLLVAESRVEAFCEALSTRHPVGARGRTASMKRKLILRICPKGSKRGRFVLLDFDVTQVSRDFSLLSGG